MGQDISSPVKRSNSQRSKVISELRKETTFTKEELGTFYDKFMEDNPTGQITKDDFMRAYEMASPASLEFADRIFNAYDLDGNGYIDAKEFVFTVCLASKGSFEEKLSWAFRLYDRDGDDYITRSEAEDIIKAIYEIEEKPDAEEKAKETTAELFYKVDRNQDDLLSKDEFVSAAKNAHILGKLLPGC